MTEVIARHWRGSLQWWALLLSLVVFFDLVPVDLWLQDRLYDFRDAHWLLSSHAWLPKLVLYDGIKALYYLMLASLMLVMLVWRDHPVVSINRHGLLVVLISCLLVPMVVGFLKGVTHIPCPKNLVHYGGHYPYVTLFGSYPEGFGLSQDIRCYPAGHASGGFALMSLFFLFPDERHARRALVAAIAVGWITGVYKMLIGDHFFSHTVISMVLAWVLIRHVDGGLRYLAVQSGVTFSSPAADGSAR